MNKLRENQGGYFITRKSPFIEGVEFKKKAIEVVFNFAYAMTFGEGEHRDHRTGGSYNRKKGQIFINAFQGKLAEIAIFDVFNKINKEAYNKLSKIDFDIYGLGEWDDSDIVLGKLKFSIKSTKHYGNLLLLETKDWNNAGEYLPNKNTDKTCIYDYFVLVRIKPDGEKVMKENRLLYSNDYIEKDHLFSLIYQEQWFYDIAGYITNNNFKYIIENDFVLPKGGLLNGKIPMDAENYYVQSGDLNDFQRLVGRFKNTN